MAKLSMLIPSRNCKYAARTVEDIYENATGDIEVIVVLDDYWPDPPIKDHKNLTVIHKGSVGGMRHSLNLGVQLARGKYIMKCDDHCMFGKGFDEILQQGMEDDWLVTLSRYSLDVVKWERGRGPTDYEYIAFPYSEDNEVGGGLYSRKWVGEDGIGKNMGVSEFYWREIKLNEKKIDDMMTFMGCFWFMAKDKYLDIGGLDEKHSEIMEMEPTELTLKVWLSGGRCVVNKNTWGAHMHASSNNDEPNKRAWRLSTANIRETARFHVWYWMNDMWPKRTKSIKDFIKFFWPIPYWPESWEERKITWESSHPDLCKNFKVFNEYGVDGMPLV